MTRSGVVAEVGYAYLQAAGLSRPAETERFLDAVLGRLAVSGFLALGTRTAREPLWDDSVTTSPYVSNLAKPAATPGTWDSRVDARCPSRRQGPLG